MTYKAAIAAAVLAVAASPIMAQGFTGGEVGIEYNAPTDGSDFGGTTYSGGLEYGFLRSFSVSVNAAGYKLDNFDTTASNITLHGTYHLSDVASVGAFYGHDDISGGTADLYGIEGGTEIMDGEVGGYLGKVDNDGNATVLGLDGRYGLRSGFSAIGNLDLINGDGVTLSQISVGAEYQMAQGPQFYAQVGSIRGDDGSTSDSVGFVTIGAKVAFGAARGTTFTNRSVFEVLPGF